MAQVADQTKTEAPAETPAAQLPATTQPSRRPPLVSGGGGVSAIIPRDVDQAFRLAQAIAAANMAPKAYDRDANKIMIGIMHGMEVGFTPMAALQSIAVINGMPAIWGDGMLALVRDSGLCESIREWIDGEGDAAVAWCETRRRGDSQPTRASFSMADAKKAGLASKTGPWTQYPKRMLQMRARSFCLRDTYPDVLRGLRAADEVQDIQMVQSVEGEWEPAASMADRPRREVEATRMSFVDLTGEVCDPVTASEWCDAFGEAWNNADIDARSLLIDNNREVAQEWSAAGESDPMALWNERAGDLDLQREEASRVNAEPEQEAGAEDAAAPEAEPEIVKIFIAKSMDADQVKATVEAIYTVLRAAPNADWLRSWRRKNETPLADLPAKARESVGKAIEKRMAELLG